MPIRGCSSRGRFPAVCWRPRCCRWASPSGSTTAKPSAPPPPRTRKKTPTSDGLGCQRVQNARPGADALVEAFQVELFVGRMHAVIVEREADQERVHAEHALEVGDDRD